MNKKLLASVVVVIVIAAVVGGVMITKDDTAKQSKQKTSDTTQSTNMDNSSSSSNSTQTAQATNSVTIQDMAFSPANITVKAGTTVTWTNSDSDAHTVTESDSKTGPNSGTLENGKSYTFTYDTPGTYQYHCTIHPSMMGTVTVTE